MNDPLINSQLGNYRLMQVLGEGSFARVYLGQHVHLNNYVAIKVLTAQLDVQDEQEFRKEAILLVSFKNAHIVRILDYGITDNRPYIVMDLARNGSLHKVYPHGTRVPLLKIVAYVSQIADALGYAHERNVVHRDIKPENILVGDTGELLLADFGIAKLQSTSSSHRTNTMAGTLAYMSPEQFDGQPGPASDQYALGIMTYEWLTGRFPFVGTIAEVTGQHINSAPPPMAQFNPEVTPEIEWAVQTALKKDPSRRFRTVQAFANALRQAAQVDIQQVSSVKVPIMRTPRPPIRQSGPTQTPERQNVPPEQKISADNNQFSRPPEKQYVPQRQPLAFSELPALPVAQLTDFWWPTFIIPVEERRTINKSGLPAEQLSAFGSLASFPSLPAQLPISNAPTPPSNGTLRGLQPLFGSALATPVLHDSQGQSRSSTPDLRSTGPAKGGPKLPPKVHRSSSGSGSAGAASTGTTGSTQSSPRPTPVSTSAPVGWTIAAILAISLGLILSISASNNYISSAQPMLIWSWLLDVFGTLACSVGLLRSGNHPSFRGWLILFLIVVIIMMLANFSILSAAHARS